MDIRVNLIPPIPEGCPKQGRLLEDTCPMTLQTAQALSAPKHPHVTQIHDVTLEDPFHWLRAENWQEVMRDPGALDPEIRAYLAAENAHAEAELAHVEGFRDRLYRELRGRIKEDDSGVPAPDGPFAYFSSAMRRARSIRPIAGSPARVVPSRFCWMATV